MKYELRDLSPVKKTLDVEADPAEVERETEVVVVQWAHRARIPGFRPGKVPPSLVRTRFAKEIREDVKERLLSRLFSAAAEEKGLKPLGDPLLEEVAFGEDQTLRFRASFEVSPEFTLRNYRGVEVREPAAVVTDQEVATALEELRRSQVRLVTEEGREAATGDLVVADVEGTPDGGETFRRERMHIEVGATGNLPAFNAGLEGAAAGQTREFPVTYPAEYDAKHLAGKTVRYRLAVHEVKRAVYPSLDDEFAKDVGQFESLDALRDRVRGDLGERKRAEARHAVRQQVLEKVMLENPVPLPEVLVQGEIQQRMEDAVRSLIVQGIDPRRIEVDWKSLRERQEEPARKSVHARLVLDRIAALESLAVAEAELEEQIRKEAARAGEDARAVRARIQQGPGLEALKNQMLREKSLDFLSSVANIHREE